MTSMLRRKPMPTGDIGVRAQPKPGCDSCPRPCLTGPERLVGVGFRCWLAGYQTGDIGCWELAWNAFAGELGAPRAKSAITELSCWVRDIKDSAKRKIEVFPGPCATFCKDECMAVSMIAAGQHNHCPALRACAFALLEHSDVGTVVVGAQAFGNVLRDLDVVLSQDAVLNAAAVAALPANQRH